MNDSLLLISPRISPETVPFWEAANKGKLILRRCLDTGRAYFYPRDFSPFTGSSRVDWIDACGQGVVYSYSYSIREGNFQCLAYVTLVEGPTLLSLLQVESPQQVWIGQVLQVVFVDSEGGQKMPVFKPM